MAYCVYIHKSPSGKVYIGITSQKLSARFQNGQGYKKSKRFYGAIIKYGWQNFSHEIIFDGLTKEEAEKKEIELISKYRSNDRRYGYNIESGGNSVGKINDETRAKISKAHIGKILSNETKKKLSVVHRKENLSEETLEKMSKSHIGKKQTDETKSKIGKKHKGKVNTPKAIEKMILAKKQKSKPFLQYTTDMIFVKEWASLSAYERETGRNKRQVGRCLKGEASTAYGYIWKYKE
jgi:group I intron endonuclease